MVTISSSHSKLPYTQSALFRKLSVTFVWNLEREPLPLTSGTFDWLIKNPGSLEETEANLVLTSGWVTSYMDMAIVLKTLVPDVTSFQHCSCPQISFPGSRCMDSCKPAMVVNVQLLQSALKLLIETEIAFGDGSLRFRICCNGCF